MASGKKEHSGIRRGAKSGGTVQRKVKVYVPGSSLGERVTPAKVNEREITLYREIPSGWERGRGANTALPGYIRIDNARGRSYFSGEIKSGYITLSLAYQKGLITPNEYTRLKKVRDDNARNVKEYSKK